MIKDGTDDTDGKVCKKWGGDGMYWAGTRVTVFMDYYGIVGLFFHWAERIIITITCRLPSRYYYNIVHLIIRVLLFWSAILALLIPP